MVVAAVALLNEKPKPTEEEIKAGMNGNLCRCCGYAKIVKAMERAANGGAK
jgi:aerobic-type carbon monoxide dehydrogenase small subunit (CoxS/CutS family)